MHHITFYFDVLSPYAYLAFERLPHELQGLSYSVTYQPVLLGGLLQHQGQRGPVEIAHKRDWVYRQTLWLAHTHGIPLQIPASHPFNSLALQRLAVACHAQGTPNRHVTGTLFRHVWQGGGDAGDAQRLQALVSQLAPQRDMQSDEVKAQLHAHTEDAWTRGAFGVPAFRVDEHMFWGLDALPMLRARLEGDDWFEGAAWQEAASVVQGLKRVMAHP